MNSDFHYYGLYLIAIEAGFSNGEARMIAYSSQYVDNSVISYTFSTKPQPYTTIVTQNYGFWEEGSFRDIYLPFHFFPGGNIRGSGGKDGGKHNGPPDRERGMKLPPPFVCVANSAGVKILLREALVSRDPYRIGIALHTFADTWAHQNFSGVMSMSNAVSPGSPIPPVGHAQALTMPDQIDETWTDTRLNSGCRTVRNADRVLAAAGKIYRYLCLYSGKRYDDEEVVLGKFAGVMGIAGKRKERRERILDCVIEYDMEPYRRTDWLEEAAAEGLSATEDILFDGYSKVQWLMDSILYRSRLKEPKPIRPKEGFFSSNLYRWCEAARIHRDRSLAVIRETAGRLP